MRRVRARRVGASATSTVDLSIDAHHRVRVRVPCKLHASSRVVWSCGCGVVQQLAGQTVPCRCKPVVALAPSERSTEQWPRRLLQRPAKHRNPHRLCPHARDPHRPSSSHPRQAESGTGGRPCVNSYQDGARFVWTHRGNPKVCMFVRSMVNAVRRPPARHGGAQLKRGAQRGGEGGPRSRACRTAGCSGGCRRSGAGPSTPAPRQTCKSRRRRPLRVITVRSFHAPPCLSRVTLLVPNQPCGSRLTVVCRPPPSK